MFEEIKAAAKAGKHDTVRKLRLMIISKRLGAETYEGDFEVIPRDDDGYEPSPGSGNVVPKGRGVQY